MSLTVQMVKEMLMSDAPVKHEVKPASFRAIVDFVDRRVTRRTARGERRARRNSLFT